MTLFNPFFRLRPLATSADFEINFLPKNWRRGTILQITNCRESLRNGLKLNYAAKINLFIGFSKNNKFFLNEKSLSYRLKN